MFRTYYYYGMRLRGFSPGCQPKKGLIGFQDDYTRKYHNILTYSRQLTEKELHDYELDFIGETERRKKNE